MCNLQLRFSTCSCNNMHRFQAMNSMLIHVSLILVLYCVICFGADCDDAYECALQSSISETTSGVFCEGDNSCRQAGIQTTASNIRCGGAYSCYKASQLLNTDGAYSNIMYCFGLYSCARIDNIYINNGMLRCDGELSCFDSRIMFTQDDNIECYGDKACAESIIYSYADNEMRGRLSAQNSVFYSMADTGVNYFFFWCSKRQRCRNCLSKW